MSQSLKPDVLRNEQFDVIVPTPFTSKWRLPSLEIKRKDLIIYETAVSYYTSTE